MKVLAIQCVLYNPPPEELDRLCQCIAALWTPAGFRLELRTGNCGEPISFPESFAPQLAAAGIAWTHTEFGQNLGFGAGHNRLFRLAPSDRIWLLNPDALFARDTLSKLSQFADERPDCGIVEPRLSPLEHPKAVDFDTYETGWCSGCAPLVNSEAFNDVDGFDEAFFLYGEDVDLSWRIKAGGGKLYCCARASVYHSRTEPESEDRRFWNQVAELLLLRKYRRKGHLKCRIADLAMGDISWFERVLREVAQRSSVLKTLSDEPRFASWTGRLNSPLRWSELPVYVPAGQHEGAVSVSGENEDSIVESAIGAWAAGASAVYVESGADRLPFSASSPAEGLKLTGGQVPFRTDLNIQTWVRLDAVACREGWLAAGVNSGAKAVCGVEMRMSEERPSSVIRDEEGWRFAVRQLRASNRLSRISPELATLVRRISD